tara:strand:+ start:1257 stop:1634 length:378 start_codon:yes stop_codon:yes gene_type:complete
MTEKRLHLAVCKYLKFQYPDIYFLSDPSGLKMSIGMATQLKKTRSKHAQLDVVILEPNETSNGLILEIKKDRNQVYKKDGELRNNEHVKKQSKSIAHLKNKDYICEYIFNLDEAIEIITKYLKTE